MASAIPDNLVPELLAQAGEGKSASEIAQYFLVTHNIACSDAAVRKRLRRIREERAPITQAVLADKLGRTVAIDLERLEGAICRALEDEIDSRELADEEVDGKRLHQGGSDSWARIMHVVSKSRGDLTHLIALRLKLAGADDGSGKKPDAKEVQDRLVKRFEDLVNKRAQQAPGSTGPSNGSSGVH